MFGLFLFVSFLGLAAVLAWNFIPGVREKLKGWSTLLDTAVVTALYYFGLFTEGLSEAHKLGYIPKDWYVYVPVILAAGIIAKRLLTTTPVGKK